MYNWFVRVLQFVALCQFQIFTAFLNLFEKPWKNHICGCGMAYCGLFEWIPFQSIQYILTIDTLNMEIKTITQ